MKTMQTILIILLMLSLIANVFQQIAHKTLYTRLNKKIEFYKDANKASLFLLEESSKDLKLEKQYSKLLKEQTELFKEIQILNNEIIKIHKEQLQDDDKIIKLLRTKNKLKQ